MTRPKLDYEKKNNVSITHTLRGHIYRLLGTIMLGLTVHGAHAAQHGVFEPQVFTLENGLTAALIENHRLPAAVHMVWYKVGSIDEPKGKSGLAHFLEHLMFKGTHTLKEGEYSKTVAKLGGEDNAFTSTDYTAYYVKIATQHLPTIMQMEADRMQNLLLSENAVKTERQVILEERRSVIDNNPGRAFSEQLNASLFLHHPYQVPIIGWRAEMEGLDHADVVNFYQHHYAPNNAIVVVSGDLTLEQFKDLVTKAYGNIKPRDIAHTPDIVEPASLAARTVTMRTPDIQRPIWRRAYKIDSYAKDGSNAKACTAVEVLAQILGGSDTSHLYQELVVNAKIANDIHVSADIARRGPGVFTIDVTPIDGKPATLEKIETLVNASLKHFQEKPVDGITLQRAVSSLQAEAVYARDSLMYPATIIGQTLTTHMPLSMIEEWPIRLGNVTSTDVQNAVSQLSERESVTGQLLPSAHP